MTRLSKTLEIRNRRGLHARASAKFVNLVCDLGDDVAIEVQKDGSTVTGKSIMGLMMLGAAMGDTITIHVEGEDDAAAGTALEQLSALVEDRFGEE